MRRRITAAAVLIALAPATGAATHAPDYVQPVPGPIVRHFEPPPDPYGPGHRGLDFAAERGTRVVAAAAGEVTFAGQVGGELFVSVVGADGLKTTYSFLDEVLVARGQAVVQGEVIARSGAGHAGSQAPHLHFGVRRGDDYLDPEPILLESMRRNLWRVVRLAP